MRPNPVSTLARVLLLALLVLLIAHAPQAAAQTANIVYAGSGVPAVNERHQTNTRIVTEHYDSGGRLLATLVCRGPSLCQQQFPAGSARYAMVVEYDTTREELVGSSCNGVADTVAQGQCINAALTVRMRLRYGTVRWNFVPDARPGKPIAAPRFGSFGGSEARLEFATTDGSTGRKYWEPRTFRTTSAGFPTAVGDYDVVIPQMSGACKPVHTNPTERLSVREGQVTEFTVRYTGTRCTVAVQNYDNADPADAGSVISEPSALNCTARAGFLTCKGEFDFDTTPRIIARPASGWQTSFSRIFTGCSNAVADPGTCQMLADGDRELSVDFSPATAPPPPPPPVTLNVARGNASPADGEVAKGSNAVPMLQLMLTPANGVVRLRSLTLQASGSGRDDLDLGDVRVINDLNANGRADAGEPQLASGRVLADNGSLRLDVAASLEFSQPTAVLVVADIATSINSAAAATATGVLLALGAVGWVRARRPLRPLRPRRSGPALLAALLLLAACNGSGDDPAASDPPPAPPPTTPPVTPPVTPPQPVLLTYGLQLTAVQATDTATAPAPLAVTSLPVAGARITVQQ